MPLLFELTEILECRTVRGRQGPLNDRLLLSLSGRKGRRGVSCQINKTQRSQIIFIKYIHDYFLKSSNHNKNVPNIFQNVCLKHLV